MSCLAESALLLYVEAELDGAELRQLESHLVACRDCRANVVALRDESRLLGDVLLERERSVRLAVRPRAPEPGMAIGLPAAVAAVTAALAVVGFLLETGMPGGLDHLNPLHLKGAYEVAFDLIFFLRSRAPGMVELALSIGAVAGVSAVLTFAVGVLYRRAFGATVVVLLGLLTAAGNPAQGLVVRFDEDTQVSASEVIEETMWLTGEVVHIDGVIEGDLIVSAERVTIGGTVKGSVYAMSRDLELTGTVEGNLLGLIEHARIDGRVKGSIYQLVEELNLAQGGVVERDLHIVSETGIVGGRIGRDVVFGGEKLELRSEVGRNVDVRWAERVALRDGARIAGNLDAVLEDEEHFERAPGAQVGGAVNVQQGEGFKDHYLAAYRDPMFWALHGLGLVASFLFGLLLRFLVPKIFDTDLTTSPEFFRSIGYGFLVIVVTPIAIVLTALTVVGIPVAVLALFIYVVLFYSAEIVVGAWLGRVLWPPSDETLLGFGRSYFVGLSVLLVVGHIPFLGPPVVIVATLIGAGLLFEKIRKVVPLPGT